MTNEDRVLLEKAARAAGVAVKWSNHWEGFESQDSFDVFGRGDLWNPLHDDGDAFRLMVALRLSVSYSDPEENGSFVGVYTNSGYSLAREPGVNDNDTRRAIVRAAAALVDGEEGQ